MISKRNVLSASIAMVIAGNAVAQGPQLLEEVIVTGTRASLQKSMDVKRDSKGVVEAITAEDIGKFPDTNLAESLQRISGVSIDRSNNEGSKVTVRGFGPDFNLITLNGRQMPTTSLKDPTRSFDFANIASEGVSAVEVFKTFGADQQSGGIGSAINIKTARPLDKPGLVASFGMKAMHDTTNENGDDVTPEISGIISNTFADDTIGISLSASHQERDSQLQQADIALWRENIDDLIPESTIITDNRTRDTNTWYPRNFGYGVEDITRTRDNAQLALQWAPNENITATLDYTWSEFEEESLRNGVGIWFGDFPNTTEVEIDKNGTYVYVQDQFEDYAANERFKESRNENNSVGFNLEWQVTENLNLALDAHDSDAISEGVGRGDDTFLILAAPFILTKTVDSRGGGDFPDLLVEFDPNARGIVDGQPTADSYDSLFAQAGANVNESDITEIQLDGIWESDEQTGITAIQFGLSNTDMTYRSREFNSGQIAAGWYGGNQDVYDNSIFSQQDQTKLLKELSGDIDVPYYYDWDYEKGIKAFEQEFNGGERLAADRSSTPVFDHEINEETTAAYMQILGESDFNDMPVTFRFGLRYEETDVTANSLQIETEEVVWINSTEWGVNRAEEETVSDESGDYQVWLPNVDLSLEFIPDVIARFSYSQSITRPTLLDVRGTTTVTDRPKPSERTADSGNPALDPFTSDNFDLSLEWYYGDTSYVSVGYFRKLVENFIVNQTTDAPIGNLRDPAAGPRAQQAVADLNASGGDANDPTQVHDQINANMGRPAGTAITQQNNDPLIDWMVTTPTNLETAELYGMELAIQHLFGDSGFGVMANATFVEGDVDVDVSQVGFQFVLPGLSDSANFVAFYEKNAWQARIAYNWRDEFLSTTESNQPQFTEEYGQWDMNASYMLPWFDERATVFIEALNVTDESQRIYNRYDNQLRTANQFGARYNLGFRYTF
ncbi:MAG: TonB-dependent receptor [Halioglobus sp.]